MKTTDMGSFGELLCNYLYISDLVSVFEKMSFLVISVDFVIYFPMQNLAAKNKYLIPVPKCPVRISNLAIFS